MSKAVTVKEAVKETLVGSQEPAQFSAQTKARFVRHAVKDPETGELCLGPEEFIDAVAPPHEDYVSNLTSRLRRLEAPVQFEAQFLIANFLCIAQDQKGAVLHPVPRRRPEKQGQTDARRLGVLREHP